MRELIRRGGLRLKLAAAISAVSMSVVLISFYAIHAAAGADLRDRIDQELRDQSSEFDRVALGGDVHSRATLAASSQHFLNNQGYHPEARIFAIQIPGRPPLSNEREVLERRRETEPRSGEAGEAGGAERVPTLLSAPFGYATVATPETGDIRVLSRPIKAHGRQLGTFRVANPLSAVEDAESGVRNTFLLVGALALALSVGIAIWLANLITRPLRRMAEAASAIDAGDLTDRIPNHRADEIGVVADAFNGMLDRLEDAFSRQRAFVSDASHELRSPLTVLRGQIEVLGRVGASAEERDRTTTDLLREIDRMNRLVDDMLTLARSDSGTLLEPRRVDVGELLVDLERELPLLGDRDFRVSGGDGITIEADPDRLIQVFRNLLSNAISHTSASGKISIAARALPGRAEFSVTDNGTGIEPDQLTHLFDRFYRTDAGRARDSGGSGLGLAIAAAIVEAHGGTIEATSTPGAGTTITFTVPR